LLLAGDNDGLESMKDHVISLTEATPETSTKDLLTSLVIFEKIGVKKVPQRLEVLQELK